MLSSLEVWRFPKELSRDDREDILKHFGACKVVHTKKRNQDSAIASFESESSCRYALDHLHQLEVLGKRLVAVYHNYILGPSTKEPHKNKENWEDTEKKSSTEEKQKKLEEYHMRLSSICPELGIKQSFPPHLKLYMADPAFNSEKILIDFFLRYNMAMPSSTTVEHLFSLGKDIIRAKRNSLSDENFNILMFTKGNILQNLV